MAPMLAVVGGGSIATGAALTAIAGTQVVGAVQQGQAAQAEAKSKQNIANFNAQVQTQEAKAKRTAAAFASKRQAEKATRIKSSLKTQIAKSGGIGSLVAKDLAAEQASEQSANV